MKAQGFGDHNKFEKNNSTILHNESKLILMCKIECEFGVVESPSISVTDSVINAKEALFISANTISFCDIRTDNQILNKSTLCAPDIFIFGNNNQSLDLTKHISHKSNVHYVGLNQENLFEIIKSAIKLENEDSLQNTIKKIINKLKRSLINQDDKENIVTNTRSISLDKKNGKTNSCTDILESQVAAPLINISSLNKLKEVICR